MKLYFRPDTCALSPHIVLRELGLPFELVEVDRETRITADGDDFLTINPKGYVAALMLDDGQVLTEGPAIVQYLADLRPEAGLAPANGAFERIRLQEWLSFISSEIHAGSNPLFNSAIPEHVKAIFKNRLFQRFDQIAATLERQEYLLGATFSVADAYLFTVLGWMQFFEIDLNRWPAISAYFARIGSRPAVKAAVEFETAAKKARLEP